MKSIDPPMSASSTVQVDRVPERPKRSISLSESIVSGLVGLTDAAILSIVGFLCYMVVGWDPNTYQTYFAEIAISTGLTVSVFQYAGLYDFNTIVGWPSRMRQMIMLTVLVALLLISLALALNIASKFDHSWFFGSFATSAVLIFGSRGIAKMFLRSYARAGILVRNLAVIGASGQAQHLVERLKAEDAPWKRIVGIFDDRRTRISRDVQGIPVLGNLDDLVSYVRQGRIHDVVITLPWSADERLVSIISRLRALPVHIYLGSDLIGYHFPRHREQLLDGVPVLEIASAPLTGWSGLVKMIEDKIVAAGVLLLFAPIMIMIAIAIKLDSSGPIFFRQKRHGFNNQVIDVWKFRSMYHNMRDENAVRQTERGDPRVTRVGAFIRRTSLDELPQLFNVLQGDMSIVGPRPHALKTSTGGRLFEEVVAEYAARHRVKPGLTGWAQVNGFRGNVDEEWKILKRVEFDIYYIENWSIWFDIKILFMTLWVGMRDENAF